MQNAYNDLEAIADYVTCGFDGRIQFTITTFEIFEYSIHSVSMHALHFN